MKEKVLRSCFSYKNANFLLMMQTSHSPYLIHLQTERSLSELHLLVVKVVNLLKLGSDSVLMVSVLIRRSLVF